MQSSIKPQNASLMYQRLHKTDPPPSFKVLSNKDQFLFLKKELQPLLKGMHPSQIHSSKELEDHLEQLTELRMMDIFIGLILKYPSMPHNVADVVNSEYDRRYSPSHLAKHTPEVIPVFCTSDCEHSKKEKEDHTHTEKRQSGFSPYLNAEGDVEYSDMCDECTENSAKDTCKDKKCEKCRCVPEIKYKKFCVTCNELKENKLMLCGYCKQVAYCNVECQKKNWNVHKKYCIPASSACPLRRGQGFPRETGETELGEENKVTPDKESIFAMTLFFTLYEKSEPRKIIGALNGILNRHIPLLPGQSKDEEEMRHVVVMDYGKQVRLIVRSTLTKPYLAMAKAQGIAVQALPYMEYVRKIEGSDGEIIAASSIDMFLPPPDCKNRGEYRKMLRGYLNNQHEYQHLYNGEAAVLLRL
jgi:hypothetical protein